MTTPDETHENAMTDYTTWRKGKKAGRDGVIQVCPRCGRKGAARVMAPYPPQRTWRMLNVAHKVRPIWGGAAREVTDSCLMRLDDQGQPILTPSEKK